MAYDWLVTALRETFGSIESVLSSKGDEAFDAATACPGWTVRDIVNHLTGTELFLLGGDVPAWEGEWPVHVRNQIGHINEAFVASRRSLSRERVLADFHAVTSRRLEELDSLDEAQWEETTWSPLGDRPRHQTIETRVLDAWIHLQDVRDALLEPADDHGPGEEVVVNTFEAATPYVWAKRANAPEGSRLRVRLRGRLARVIEVEVRGGRGVAAPVDDDEVAVEVTTAVALFWRAMAGRITSDAFLRASATTVRGDLELAHRWARGMVIVP